MQQLLFSCIYDTISTIPKELSSIIFEYDSRCFHKITSVNEYDGKFMVVADGQNLVDEFVIRYTEKNVSLSSGAFYKEHVFGSFFAVVSRGIVLANLKGAMSACDSVYVRDVFEEETTYILDTIDSRTVFNPRYWFDGTWSAKNVVKKIVSNEFYRDHIEKLEIENNKLFMAEKKARLDQELKKEEESLLSKIVKKYH
jgi:hypothetical protein